MAHGINVALIGYTLAPDATLEQIVAEIHAGIDDLAARLPELGADASRLVASGWSAGGHLTAMAMLNKHVKGGVAISGIYDLEPIRHSYLNVKLGLDEAMSKRNSPMLLSARGQADGIDGRRRRTAAASPADRRFRSLSRQAWLAGDLRGNSRHQSFHHHG